MLVFKQFMFKVADKEASKDLDPRVKLDSINGKLKKLSRLGEEFVCRLFAKQPQERLTLESL